MYHHYGRPRWYTAVAPGRGMVALSPALSQVDAVIFDFSHSPLGDSQWRGRAWRYHRVVDKAPGTASKAGARRSGLTQLSSQLTCLLPHHQLFHES